MEFNYVCSLGSLCHTASFLQRNNLKFTSYPFDWIFSNYGIILHCLEDNFNTFLNKSFYRSIDQSQCGHEYYDKTLCGPMWRHHNPLTNEENYDYITRCIFRFNTLIKLNEPKLFIMTFVNFKNVEDRLINELIQFNNIFSKFVRNYTLLIIIHIPLKDKNYHSFKNIGNIHFLEIHTISESLGTYFKEDIDNVYLDQIIKSKYKFNLI
jgi:hypothetical protein